MRLLKVSGLLMLAMLLGAGQSAGDTIFADDFNSEHGTVGVLNYNAFTNWTVSDGTVDLIGNGYYDFLPGNGLYVDMDGSTGNAGRIMTKAAFEFLDGVQYSLSFDLAGNHRNASTEAVYVKVSLGGLVNNVYSLSRNAPFQRFTVSFTGNSLYSPGALSFEGADGDNIGMLLDNVRLERVPDVGFTGALLGIGIAALGLVRRRR